ncbi:MAG: hypothetical protein RBR58_02240 [Candidatus Humimicrobiaceae bacterium]|nr:hypothetical protein [Actinomycetota bacterium]MDD5600567.1 hypothetical protein [Actinomycetota bacterium]MDY0027804.1 hypothetical protein [Candidatus Humimicrobiaceae bacterium]
MGKNKQRDNWTYVRAIGNSRATEKIEHQMKRLTDDWMNGGE